MKEILNCTLVHREILDMLMRKIVSSLAIFCRLVIHRICINVYFGETQIMFLAYWSTKKWSDGGFLSWRVISKPEVYNLIYEHIGKRVMFLIRFGECKTTRLVSFNIMYFTTVYRVCTHDYIIAIIMCKHFCQSLVHYLTQNSDNKLILGITFNHVNIDYDKIIANATF